MGEGGRSVKYNEKDDYWKRRNVEAAKEPSGPVSASEPRHIPVGFAEPASGYEAAVLRRLDKIADRLETLIESVNWFRIEDDDDGDVRPHDKEVD